jgi:sulfur relay protein TusB/DsrH
MMKLGFILTKTPAEEGYNTFKKFLKMYIDTDDVTIYLIGNGVYNFRKRHPPSNSLMELMNKSKRSLKIYTCLDDLNARGINVETLVEGVVPFETYDMMVVDIMENMDQVHTF